MQLRGEADAGTSNSRTDETALLHLRTRRRRRPITPIDNPVPLQERPAQSGPYRTLHNLDDHRRTSDGR